MHRLNRRLLLASLVAACAAPAMAETLRCRSVNGNVTCAGSGAVSCQTVNGRTTCTSGGIVQEFGGRPSPPAEREAPVPEEDADDPPPRPRRPIQRQSVERDGPGGRLFLERDGSRLRLRRDDLAIDLD